MKASISFFSFLLMIISASKILYGNVNYISFHDTLNTPNELIIGKWDYCALEFNLSVTKFLVCPTIEFESNGIGKINTRDSIFTWKLSDSCIEINESFLKTNSVFNQSFYKYTIANKSDYWELRLITCTGSVLILRKAKFIHSTDR